MENFLFFCFSLCFDIVPFVGVRRECRGYVAFWPTCGPPKKAGLRQPILILSRFVWISPRMQGLCSISAHLWANSDFVTLHLGTPENAGVM